MTSTHVSDYAWTITRDNAAEKLGEAPEAVGISGPRDAPQDLLTAVRDHSRGHTFYLYDDDDNLCYTGRLVTESGAMGDEAHCYAPLADFGEKYGGCTRVHWHGHKEWDCG